MGNIIKHDMAWSCATHCCCCCCCGSINPKVAEVQNLHCKYVWQDCPFLKIQFKCLWATNCIPTFPTLNKKGNLVFYGGFSLNRTCYPPYTTMFCISVCKWYSAPIHFPFFVGMPVLLFGFDRRCLIVSLVFWPQSCQCSSVFLLHACWQWAHCVELNSPSLSHSSLHREAHHATVWLVKPKPKPLCHDNRSSVSLLN